MKHIRALKSLGACDSAIEFAGQFETLETVWQACKRGDWMLWLVMCRYCSLTFSSCPISVIRNFNLNLLGETK